MRLKRSAPTARLGGSPARVLDRSHALVPAARPPGPDLRGRIILKGLDGVLEVLGGLLLLVVSPATIDRVVTSLTQHELSEAPTTCWPATCCGLPTG
jgi:hypothetical protein